MDNKGKTKWVTDPAHSEFAFKVRHMMISTVTGHFDRFEAIALTDGDDLTTAEVEVTVDTASVNTNNKDRDAHLRSDDFFNAEAFPKLTFKSDSFDGEKMTGKLTIRDTTKEITLNTEFNGMVVDPAGRTKAGFEITGEINRKEFGLRWNAITEAGNAVVSDKVKIVVDAQFIRQE